MAYELDQAVVDQLTAVGFSFLTAPGLDLELAQEMALRQFQSCAAHEFIAQWDETPDPARHYLNHLTALKNPIPYDGKPHGHPDDKTKTVLKEWFDKKYRLPIVVTALFADKSAGHYKIRNGNLDTARFADEPSPQYESENLFVYDKPVSLKMPLGTYFYFLCFDQKGDPSQVRFFVRDFSQYYKKFEQNVPPLPRDLDCLAVSRYQKSGTSSKDTFNGPVSLYQECYRDVTPERLTKKAYSDLGKEEKITYRVVRSVCRAECLGFLDSINAHDSAYISIGLYHWAFAHLSLKAFNEGCTAGPHPATGELEAFLAYIKYKYADTYDAAFAAFGVEPSTPWTGLTPTGIRTYENALSQWIYHADSTGAPAPALEPVDPTCARYNYLRSWHMFYRFQMATRVFPEVWQAAWDMARFRLRDILSAEIPKEWGFSNGTQAPLHVGDLITSEVNVAFLLQWHIVAPATLISNGKARVPLQRALKGLSPDPTKWTSLDEARIYKRFIGAAEWKPDPPRAKLKTPTKLLRDRMKNQILRCSLKALDYPDGVLAGYPPNKPGTNTKLPIAALSPLRGSFRLAQS